MKIAEPRRYLCIGLLIALVAASSLLPRHAADANPNPTQSRPKLSGEERTHATTHFVIHYTQYGIDAVPGADGNGDGTPDWVEEVGRVMEAIWSVEVGSLGWPAPLPDQGEGGDTRFDVYLMELFSRGIAGYVSSSGGLVGDHPNTARIEQQASYGFLVLDNDYVDPNPPPGLKVWPPEDWVRIIAAHEFNHMLQVSINGTHAMRWWYEATANWMETQVFPHLPDALESADAVFKSPDTCMLRYGGVNRVESGLHWYGMWVFNQSLAEQYGASIIRDIWLAIGDGYGYDPFDEIFAARGTTFDDEVRRFALNVLLRNFQEGHAYPTARLQEAVDAPGEWSPVDGVQRYAMDYIGLNLGTGTYTVTVTSDDPGVEGIVVGVNGGMADVYPPGNEVTVDFGQYQNTYLIVLNLTRPPHEAGCATARYTYAVGDAAGGPTPVSNHLAAGYFSAPRVEAVTDPEDVPVMNPFYETEYNIREEISEVDLPFRPIVPRGKPAGYELDSVYGFNADELGAEFVAHYAPSGGIVAQMLYYNGEGQMLRITESPSIYVTIGEWAAINELEYKPDVQVWTTGNLDAVVWDRGGAYLVTFLHRQRFLAIDGDAPLEDMLDMAARFAASTSSDLPEPRGPAPDYLKTTQ